MPIFRFPPKLGGIAGATSGTDGAVLTSAQSLDAGQQAQARTNIGAGTSTFDPASPGPIGGATPDTIAATLLNARKPWGVQYLTANAVWDGSLLVASDSGGAYNLSLAGVTGACVLIISTFGADINITNSPGGLIDGTIAGGTTSLAWINSAHTDGLLSLIG